MSESKPNVPKLRFPGFTDPWEQRKLGDEFKRVNERNDGSFGRSHWISVAKMYFQDPEMVQSNNLDTRTYVMREGDIAFEGHPNAEFSYGRFVVNDIGDGIVSELFPVYRHISSYDRDYWKYAIQIERTMAPIFAKSITSSGNSSNKLDPTHFLKQSIYVPSLPEQRAIGAFFRDLDDLIALHQRKLDDVRQLKRGMLQKMFPKDGSSVPEVRFPGFTDPWEQRKLGDVARRVTRKNTDNESDLPLTISAQHGLVDQKLFFNKQVASKDMSGYFLLRRGEFAYNRSTSNVSPWGAVKRLTKYEKGCLSPLYICFELVGADPDWLSAYYEGERWHREIQYIATEGARNHGMLNVSPDDFFQTAIMVPRALPEQRLIGAFFRDLDDLIALHQRELDHIKLLKKALLQQMFV